MAPKNSTTTDAAVEPAVQENGETSALPEVKKPTPIDPYRAAGIDKKGDEVVVISDPVIFLTNKYMPGDHLLVTTEDARMLDDDGVIED